MQKLIIVGRVGQDAEVKDFPASQLISFSVAVSETYVKKSTNEKVTNTTWYECSIWRNDVSIAQYIRKGDFICLEGTPNNRAYLSNEGDAKLVNGINVSKVELLGSKPEGTTPSQPRQERPQANQTNSFVDGPATDFKEEEHDDLPF